MEIELIKTQKVLSPTQISLADYVINPFRGCEFGCAYCYSQENKNFSQSVKAKINAPQVLEKELRFIRPKRVLLGSTTECFQYAELSYHLTEQILKILNAHSIPCTILTKSHLIKNYLGLIVQNKANKIYFTLNCASDKIIRGLEGKSPDLAKRRETIHAVLDAGIALRIHIGPFIPEISDLKKIVELIPETVAEIDVELYHSCMGNFPQVLAAAKKHLGADAAEKLAEVYADQGNYARFAGDLKAEILKLKKSGRNFFYIVPDYKKFYDGSINYEQPVF